MHRQPPACASPARALRDAVRLAACAAPAIVVGASLTSPRPAAAAPFPPVVPLKDLFAATGGDGSTGFVLINDRLVILLPGDQPIPPPDLFGESVSTAGDVNGDGFDDLVAGAPLKQFFPQYCDAYDYGRERAVVVLGDPAGFPAELPLSALYPDGDGSDGFVLFGTPFSCDGRDVGDSVRGAGDVNGDGIDDLVIGAPYPTETSPAGMAYVVFGRDVAQAGNFPPGFALESLTRGDGSEGFALLGVQEDDLVGVEVSGAGDINADGIDDLVIGAPSADPRGLNRAGNAYVVFGRTQGFPPVFELKDLLPGSGGDGSEGFVVPGTLEDDRAGSVVSSAGDVNGDGIDDLLVAAERADAGGGVDGGETYVIFGRAPPFPPAFELKNLLPGSGGDGSEGFVLADTAPGALSGIAATGIGDFNADGIDDLGVGARGRGDCYVFYGKKGPFAPVYLLPALYPPNGDGSDGAVIIGNADGRACFALAGAGDVNGDQIDDLVIGAPYALGEVDPDPIDKPGAAYVVFGAADFEPAFALANLWPARGGDGSRGFVLPGVASLRTEVAGWDVSGAGDLNADGVDDVLIGAPGRLHAGMSYVVYGRRTDAP